MVSGNGANRGDPRQSPDQRLKRLHPACPIHQVSTKQHNVRGLSGCDLRQAVNNVARPMSSQMKVARKQNTLLYSEVQGRLTANQQRSARPHLDALEQCVKDCH
jgi:hypothetical protein